MASPELHRYVVIIDYIYSYGWNSAGHALPQVARSHILSHCEATSEMAALKATEDKMTVEEHRGIESRRVIRYDEMVSYESS